MTICWNSTIYCNYISMVKDSNESQALRGEYYTHTTLLTYLSRVSEDRTGLCCPVVSAEPPLHDTHPHIGRCQHHSCSPLKTYCRCSCCCFLPSLPCSCGCCQYCASTLAESYWPSCTAWHLMDSRHLRETDTDEVTCVFIIWIHIGFVQ